MKMNSAMFWGFFRFRFRIRGMRLILIVIVLLMLFLILSKNKSLKVSPAESLSWEYKYEEENQVQYSNSKKVRKLILLYNPLFGQRDLSAWSASNTETFRHCPAQCEFTTDRKLMNQSHALIYHTFHHHKDADGVNHLPLPRPAHLQDQIWVFYLLEPPATWNTQFSMEEYAGVFNWTMTYRWDSDIQWPYGGFRPLRPGDPIQIPSLESIAHKKLAAAMTSRKCKRGVSGREDYIRELQKHVQVDHYGACGNLNCSADVNCYKLLAPRYKFWLSFENSFCAQYVTEKFFRALRYGMVPIVYGQADYFSLAPKGSFINTKDFKEPKELGAHLLYLDKHPEEYLKYFEWRKDFKVLDVGLDPELQRSSWCRFCRKLHANRSTKSYPSVEDWYRRNGTNSSVCRRTFTELYGLKPIPVPRPRRSRKKLMRKFRKS